MSNIKGKRILITGASKRIGRAFAVAAAQQGVHIFLHYSRSKDEALQVQQEIQNLGSACDLIQANFDHPEEAIEAFEPIFTQYEIYALVNNASIFLQNTLRDTSIQDWNMHQSVNLTMPFLLTQAYANSTKNSEGRIINLLDWRALRPGKDHFAYTISKSGLAALTKASALALAPQFQVNGMALGAILPPSDGSESDSIIKQVPAGRWAEMDEVIHSFLFLLESPRYITGEIIHIDGGRHLV
ncbi:MAG TPA: hypothetical protein DCK95_07720 [Anaerolineaceae bacterium]|uniref:Short-chain dehydrogenase/reductase n=1 Tax=Anaerolinea thermophila TaxID=167964 RepID=A0A101FZ77_9CHLR|nr:MAG: Short-chain dehydrogenase/reductase [Anaerolinea thermophila]HAF62197.1 hypothetical protein [Anaerolineaceae bacterium]